MPDWDTPLESRIHRIPCFSAGAWRFAFVLKPLLNQFLLMGCISRILAAIVDFCPPCGLPPFPSEDELVGFGPGDSVALTEEGVGDIGQVALSKGRISDLGAVAV